MVHRLPLCVTFSQNLNFLLTIISGAFPLSDVSLMTDEERERFLPATRTFVRILENGNASPADLSLLLKQSSELIPSSQSGKC